MSEQQYPSILQQGKNLAKFSLDLITYIHKNQGEAIIVSDKIFNERLQICKSCEKYDEQQNKCKECGCFVPAKAKIILDSCPLNKWGVDTESWEENFNNIAKKIDESQDSNLK
jgi:hypothetical protein